MHKIFRLYQLIQGFIYILFNTLYGYNTTYAFITQSNVKSSQRIILDSVLSTIGLNISYLYMAVSLLTILLLISFCIQLCHRHLEKNVY